MTLAGTSRIVSLSCQSRHNAEAYSALQEFYGAAKPDRMYTDNAPELIRACRDLGYNHDKSMPCRHESNATCERCVRYIVEGARALLEKAGLSSCFWIFAVHHYCLMHNTCTLTNGESQWLRRFGEELLGKRLPFGSLVNFLPEPETGSAEV